MRYLVLQALLICGAASAAEFIPLGDFAGGDHFSSANAVSNNGVVVGYGNVGGARPFRWTAETGMVNLGSIPGGSDTGIARDITADGSTITGVSSGGAGYHAFRWTESGGFEDLGDLPGGQTTSEAQAISADGSTVVGRGSGTTAQAFVWTEPTGIQPLGTTSATNTAMDVSADGSVIVGKGNLNGQAWRWTAAGGVQMLGYLGGSISQANAVSASGNYIAGFSTNATNPNSTSFAEAFLWSESTGMQGLGYLDGGSRSIATDVSSDGRFVVGQARTADDNVGYIWTETLGMKDINQLLAEAGVDLGGYTINSISAISDDGRYIVGNASNANGDTEAFFATTVVPVPAAVWLFASALFAAGVLRRRSR